MESARDAKARKNRDVKNPFVTAGFLSKLSFSWLVPLFYKGFKVGLTEDDIYPHLKSHDSEILGDKLEREWNKEVKSNKENPSLWRAFAKVFGKEMIIIGIFRLMYELLRISLPLILSKLLEYFKPNTSVSTKEAYIYASTISLTTLIYITIQHYTFFQVLLMGMRLRVAATALIYRKAVRLSRSALARTTVGQMVNMISNDVSRLELCTMDMNYLWVGPIQLCVILVLLYLNTGWTGIPGIGLLLCCIPFQIWMAKKTSVYRLKIAIKTDERIRLMNEIISGIQVIKMYTWEKPFAKIVESVRRLEMKDIQKNSILKALHVSLNTFLTRTIIYFSILVLILSGNKLNAKYVYVISLFYELLRMCMSNRFAQGITQLAEADISVRRIQEFLLYDEIKLSSSNFDIDTNQGESGVCLENVSARWIKTEANTSLNYINFNVSSGELATVIGKVGSGKSTLLHIILKELPPVTGNIKVNGSISYASQEPWLFVGNVRQNILFGQEYDFIRYHEVARVCALERDFKLLPYGDRTLIGERGVSLSGGQRARINLARAIYKEADIYLLDDPLSAVDAHVGKHIFDECINGYLKDKCVVLVTHQLQYLKGCKKIYLLKDGQVDQPGTYKELENSGKDFTNILEEFKKTEEEAKNENLEELNNRRKTVTVNEETRHSIHLHNGNNVEHAETYKDTKHKELTKLLDEHKEIKKNTENILADGETHVNGGETYKDIEKQKGNILENRETHVTGGATYKGTKNEELTKLLDDNKELENDNKRNVSQGIRKQEENRGNKNLDYPKIEKEAKIDGKVSWQIYKTYFLAGGSLFKILVLVSMFFISQAVAIGNDYFLSVWVNMEQIQQEYNLRNHANDTFSNNMDSIHFSTVQQIWFKYCTDNLLLIIYTFLIITAITLLIGRSVLFCIGCMHASINLHNNMFSKIVYSKMRFFNTNPSGRILNRFSKDMNLVDESLPGTFTDAVQIAFTMGSVVVIVAIVTPKVLIPTSSIFIMFYLIRMVYINTGRDIKRIEGITRSPVYSHLTASLQGLTTIRAFGAQEILREEFDNYNNSYSSSHFMVIATSRFFAYWLDLPTVLFATMVTFSFLIFKNDVLGGSVGLAISQAICLAGWCQLGIRQWSETENTMTSVERIKEYADVVPEDDSKTQEPPKNWPEIGNIQFKNVFLRYAEDDPYVLKNLNFTIKSFAKVGIVGRTGAGKSSIIAALFRLTETEGHILIDNVDTKSVSLNRLRSSLSIIPQEPVLFSGSLRKNLDPFDEYSDEAIWNALEQVELKSIVSELPQGLENKMSEGGSNFSVGQKQLVCLARALVKKNKILLLDEATANVDPHTDALIQSTIREKFSSCTVLTIAHRLHTIMDSDKVLVMDAGTVVEFDHPHVLLQNEHGVFSGLVMQTGEAMAANLSSIAAKTYRRTLPINGEDL